MCSSAHGHAAVVELFHCPACHNINRQSHSRIERLDPADPRLQVEVPANTALVVCREKGGILNILLAPLGEQGSHTR